MRSTKTAQFQYASSEELSSLFEDFRLMCNDAIRIAVEKHPRNKFELIELAYSRLKAYGLHSHYTLSACEVAYSLYRNKNRKSVPYARKPFLKLDNQSYVLNHLILRIPSKPKHFIYLTLRGSDYHFSFLNDPRLKRGSITLTSQNANIAFSKEVSEIEPLGYIGIDINERNITIADSVGGTRAFDLSKVADIKEMYKEIRAKISRRTRRDSRVKRRLCAKYGRRERNRTAYRIHEISKDVVNHEGAPFRHRHGELEWNSTAL